MRRLFKVVLASISTLVVLFSILVFCYYYYDKPWNRALFITPIYKLPTTEKIVALTFDDGPSPIRTPALLDLLDKYEIKATFFVLGNKVEQYPEISKEILSRGHQLSNHSYSHARLILKSPTFIGTEIDKTTDILRSLGDSDLQFFRPPYTHKLFILPVLLNQRGMFLVTGSYDPSSQYQKPLQGDQVAKQVIDNIEPGSIIYLHDGRDDSQDEFGYY